ncbi:MAG TPA: RodZ domain-containing protein [Anaerolineales bacterium]|jgi:cytoskeletal protein RodZ
MPTIGEQLKQAREARKLAIRHVMQAIHVRTHYLQAMENDDFSSLPSPAQARGFLRMYAEYLGLNANELIERWRAESHLEQVPPAAPTEPPAEMPEPEPIPTPPPEPPAPVVEPEPEPEPGPPPPSQTIFNEIGETLRNRRELISLTLEEVERHTHIRKHNLGLIEAGEFDRLPSPVQLRGTLMAYASFLDLDAEAVLLRYADAIQSRRIERQGSEQPKSGMRRARSSLPFWLSRFLSPDLIFGGSMILMLLALSIWGAGRIFSGGMEPQDTPTQGPSISDVLLASPVASPTGLGNPTSGALEEGTSLPTLDAAQLATTATDTLQPTASSAVQVTVSVLERTFLRVTVDGKIEQDGRVAPGAALTFDGNERIEVLTGSGTAVQIIFNQSNLGVMGNFGEVVNRIYTVNGVETPTPTPSPTPSITPIPSVTPRPTSTSRPSLTPRPTSTLRPTSTATP